MLRGHMRDFLPLWQELVPTSADRKSHSKGGSQGCDWPRRVGGRALGALWGRGHLSHVSETRATVPDNHRGSQSLSVLGDPPLTPAFGPSHTEASRNPVVWGTAQTALCGEAGTRDPRGPCVCALASSPSVSQSH